MALTVEVLRAKQRWTIQLSGEFDYESVTAFAEAREKVLKANPPACLVDLRDVTFLDSSGLGAILHLSKTYGATGGKLSLATSPAVDRILELTRLNSIFDVERD